MTSCPLNFPGVVPESFESADRLQYHGNPLRLVLDTDGIPMQTSSSQHYSIQWVFELSKPLLMLVVLETFFAFSNITFIVVDCLPSSWLSYRYSASRTRHNSSLLHDHLSPYFSCSLNLTPRFPFRLRIGLPRDNNCPLPPGRLAQMVAPGTLQGRGRWRCGLMLS